LGVRRRSVRLRGRLRSEVDLDGQLLELTADGRELAGALRLLADWGARAESSGALRHGTCGTPLEARWYCPTCARAIDTTEATELRSL
jgi:hypothetical protein